MAGTQFKRGEPVRQVQPAPVRGTVQGFGLDQETGEVTVKIGWVDADKHVHEVYLPLDHVEADPVTIVGEVDPNDNPSDPAAAQA
jgi:hypothetical protein